ncbi:MAG TPA: NUDIX hydrolase, partial [Alphaproteobacteria bacterium]|nr:NUDIX hydrolase [Alphaproteobacteria bacterium]
MAEPQPPAPRFARRIPAGEDRERLVCGDCGFIAYENPKVVVGAVCSLGDRILLCRRAIEPRRGFWTIPAGYLEEHETTEAGARREAQEEACADIAIDQLLAVY